jgi:hypothetical protein
MRKFRGKCLTGEVYGKWTIIGTEPRREIKNGQYEYHWAARCICGTEKEVNLYNMQSGKSQSCGICYDWSGSNNPNWKGYEEIPSSYWTSIKWGAQNRDIDFDLTIEEVYDLFLKQKGKCEFTGQILSFADKTASLDRIDSKKGYYKKNCQWVHKDINLMKNYFSEDVFLNYCRQIVDHCG